jgi:hypothetical protein
MLDGMRTGLKECHYKKSDHLPESVFVVEGPFYLVKAHRGLWSITNGHTKLFFDVRDRYVPSTMRIATLKDDFRRTIKILTSP